MQPNENAISEAFFAQSIRLLKEELFPRIQFVVQRLSDEQLWWRPNEASNSIGNLMLHLSGNVRQWIVGGVGKHDNVRDRDREFAERSTLPGKQLLDQLSTTLIEAEAVLRNVEVHSLVDRRSIQGNDVTVLEAIYHVVEHFSMHTGQILMLAKIVTTQDLKLYEFPDGAAKKRW